MPASDSENRFRRAAARFDEANSADPNRERFDGEDHPKELLYSRRMSAWLERLEPQAPEVVRLATRCQHLRRWVIPREKYPQGRTGYLKWRTRLGRFHADEAEAILREVGYDDTTITRVRSLLLKKNLKHDPQAQLLENVACVVFLESYFAAFSRKHEEKKILDIVRKTWRKMTPRGREAALALDLPAETRALVERAIGEEGAKNPEW